MKPPLLCSAAIAFLLFANAARAEEITFHFTGVITEVRIDAGSFEVGQVVEGSYTFDSAAVDQDPSDTVGHYQNVIRFDYRVPAANYTATGTPGSSRGLIQVLDNDEGVRDRYGVHMTEPEQNVSGDVGGYNAELLSIVMRDRTTLAVSSDALPRIPPTLMQFADGAHIFLGFTNPFAPSDVIAELTSLTVAAPTVQMSANGSDGPLTLAPGQALTIDIVFDTPGAGLPAANVAVGVATPFGLSWLGPAGFTATPTALYSGPLTDFGPATLFNFPSTAGFPAGSYRWFILVHDPATSAVTFDLVETIVP